MTLPIATLNEVLSVLLLVIVPIIIALAIIANVIVNIANYNSIRKPEALRRGYRNGRGPYIP